MVVVYQKQFCWARYVATFADYKKACAVIKWHQRKDETVRQFGLI